MITSTTQTHQLQGLNLQTDSNKNIIGIINVERLISELQELTADQNGCVRLKSELRRHAPKNGKPYTHMPPMVDVKTPQNTSTETQG